MSARILPHPAMTAAQATQLCHRYELDLRQDRRGYLRLEPRTVPLFPAIKPRSSNESSDPEAA